MDISEIAIMESPLLESDIEIKEPYHLFKKWISAAENNKAIIEPYGMCLSTASKKGIPSGRFVLCRGFNKNGFQFYTHYTSQKGEQLEENPNAALTFFWAPFGRSVRIEGTVEKLPYSEADIYFIERPYESQIGAACSDQSRPVESRDVLAAKAQDLMRKHKEKVPRPPQWGGYLVKPNMIEFWQGHPDRVNDRIRFRKPLLGEIADGKLLHQGEDGWVYERLCP